MQTKPIVRIRDAVILDGIYKDRMHGIVEDYPEDHQGYPGALENGREVITSKIVKFWDNMNRVETERTIYNVINWKEKQ